MLCGLRRRIDLLRRSRDEAEAISLLRGMELARTKHGATALRVRTDNLPIVQSLAGEIVRHATRFVRALDRVREEQARFESVDFRWAPSYHGPTRNDGAPSADVLARRAAGLGTRTQS
ncbi:MAG: reverse transcriptase-like protein [Thermoplasmata archaeon]